MRRWIIIKSLSCSRVSGNYGKWRYHHLLGRGGSDTTAVALAAALHAEACEIYTDVSGVYTADPRLVPNARQLKEISYDEMLELARLGAKVLHPRSVELARKYTIPLVVKSTFGNSGRHPGYRSEKYGTAFYPRRIIGQQHREK